MYYDDSQETATIIANFPHYDELLHIFMTKLQLKPHELYMAGGAIRDALLCRTPKDIDLFITTEKMYDHDDIVKNITEIDDLQILKYLTDEETNGYSNVDLIYKNYKIQIMNNYPNYSLDKLMSEFDYDICQYGYYYGSDEVITTEGAKVLMAGLQVMEMSPNEFLNRKKFPNLNLVNVNNVERNLKRGIIFEYRYKVNLPPTVFKQLTDLLPK